MLPMKHFWLCLSLKTRIVVWTLEMIMWTPTVTTAITASGFVVPHLWYFLQVIKHRVDKLLPVFLCDPIKGDFWLI